MALPMPSKELFMKALQLAVQKNEHLLPPPGDGVKLYLRPMLLGTGQQLGLYPSPEMSFLVYVSPTGNYFSAATTYVSVCVFVCVPCFDPAPLFSNCTHL